MVRTSVLAGLACCILAMMGLFVATLLDRTAIDVNDTRFTNEPWRLRTALVNGLFHYGLRSAVEVVLAGVATTTLLWCVFVVPAPVWRDRALVVGYCCAVPVLVGIAGLVVSIAFAPSLSDRNVAIVSPLLWVLCAAVADLAFRTLPRWGRAAVWTALILAIVPDAFWLERRFIPKREEFRASAAVVSSRPQCAGREVPVAVGYRTDRSLAVGDRPGRYVQGYYLGRNGNAPMLFAALPGTPQRLPEAVRRTMMDRIEGRDACDVVGIVAHIRGRQIADTERTLAQAGVPTNRLVVVPLPNHAMRDERGAEKIGAAVMLVRRRAS